jgi:hypothetical protein
MRYLCCQQRRLQVVKLAAQLNGIEYLEVAAAGPPQRTLLVQLIGEAAGIDAHRVAIRGGERITGIAVQWAVPADDLPAGEDPALVAGIDEPDRVLVVRTDTTGDFSAYTLSIDTAGFDPELSSVDFCFRVDCDRGYDCRDICTCQPVAEPGPQIDYLAKDYQTLRQMLLDRISLLAPDWRERNAADFGVAVVELLAYEGDRLSYRQDAIATESYLGTARSRVSLRRLARLMDYRIHDGCAARVLLRCTPTGVGATLPAHTAVYSRTAGLPDVLDPDDEQTAITTGACIFETVEPAVLYPNHDALQLYTWGDDDCCLQAGATSATLRGDFPNLKAGDILVLAEMISPTTGQAADRNPAHIWPVRLTSVRPSSDPSGGQFDNPKTNNPVAVTEITWDAVDRLRFSLCVSSPAAGTHPVSVAWGNIVVAGHGRTVTDEHTQEEVPKPHLSYAVAQAYCSDRPLKALPARYRPALSQGPLTRSVDVTAPVLATADPNPTVLADLAARTASTALVGWLAGHGVTFRHGTPVVRGADNTWSVSDGETVVRVHADAAGRLTVSDRPRPASTNTAGGPRNAQPDIDLRSGVLHWQQVSDLLGSDANARDFVVESEHDGSAYLRLNQLPPAGFTVTYRVGNGAAGNVGAGTLVHIATNPAVSAVTNPLPAAGGVDPESAEQVRRDVPQAYRIQQRAVTPEDWGDVATRNPRVQRAEATWRWTGSWHTVFVTVDAAGTEEIDDSFTDAVRADLEKYRLAGYDLHIDRPKYVPLEIGLHICVEHAHLRAPVRGEVVRAVSGLFHPDNLTFGETIYLSRIYAAAQAVPGVTSVTVDTFRRQQDTAVSGLKSGRLTMGRLEIARMDNDRSFPEHGVLTLTVGRGR